MNCPCCNIPLVMTERQGVEIDYCPQCRGIWLDRGELDKIVERSSGMESQGGFNAPQQTYSNHDQHDYTSHDQHNSYNNRKKKTWLNELFD